MDAVVQGIIMEQDESSEDSVSEYSDEDDLSSVLISNSVFSDMFELKETMQTEKLVQSSMKLTLK